ncbi:hypothetical protein DPMN_107819 [Dreissena polymorpha]|uniref:Uncharacterized protein n=1 Tax=Dreissena polymorpha TaxID=45954 RepID=A0A9D4K7W6_DREPO|nr:hypothetical protein DPMN_107819 [Dreissena polymorpha]
MSLFILHVAAKRNVAALGHDASNDMMQPNDTMQTYDMMQTYGMMQPCDMMQAMT